MVKATMVAVAQLSELRLSPHPDVIIGTLKGEDPLQSVHSVSFWVRHNGLTFLILNFEHTELFLRFSKLEPAFQEILALALLEVAESFPMRNEGDRTEVEFLWSATKTRRMSLQLTRVANLKHPQNRYLHTQITLSIRLV
jgi:hypothetical protein